MTGQSPAALTMQDVCPAPAPGAGRCQAQALVLRADRSLVRPRVHAGRALRVLPARLGPRAAAAAADVPAATAAPDPGTPGYLQQAYDMTYLSQTGGSGDTVALVDAYDDPSAEQDLATYRSTYGLAPCTSANGCFTKVNQDGNSSPLPGRNADWEVEISLDLDAVSALCPRCNILLVETSTDSNSDLQAGVKRAAALGANQISNSWIIPSKSVPSGQFTFPGIAIVAATGDAGYLGGGYSNYPAAFAGVTAAGGTSLVPASDGISPRGFAESAWSAGSDGSSAGSGCDLKVAKPWYQTDSGCIGRAYSDVSADADPATGLQVYDSGQGGWLLVGGTSLASPLIAGYYAAAAVEAPTAQWAYTDRGLLNDPISGTNGSCATAIFYICNAGPGYDGPTGAGSISGAVANGAPGVGGPSVGSGTSNTYATAVGSQTATLQGGVYPNGLDTSAWWEYGTTTSYGQRTAATDIGSGHAPATLSSALAGLDASSIYHYRLVAQNSLGTSYGYDYSLTTMGQPASTSSGVTQPINTVSATFTGPSNASAPSVSGSPRRGISLTAQLGSWAPAATTYAMQWERAGSSGFTSISGANGSTYTPGKADEGAYLRVVVTAGNAYGSAIAASAPVGPVASNPPIRGTAPVLSGAAREGSWLSARGPAWKATTQDTTFSVRWTRCRRDGTGCRAIRGARAGRYRLTRTDAGHRLVVTVTATNPDASVSVSSRASAVVAAAHPVHRHRRRR